MNHWEFGSRWANEKITWILQPNGRGQFVSIEPPLPDNKGLEEFRNLADRKESPFKGKTFRRLRSDRDISPEVHDHPVEVSSTGEGATTLIRSYLTKANLPNLVVEEILLKELNKIYFPDATFRDIIVQQLQDEKWEVFLGEAQKGRIALSESGSGLKTVLLVLIFLHLIPRFENSSLSDYIFGFEELENNTHPALQRRLFLYLRDIALTEGCLLFISSHSNVVIDLFSKDKSAQIIHVQHDGKSAISNRVLTHIDRQGILDDLDVRASDLLQSNGVVWVEGPSDRIFFNRWIDLWTDGELREGANYQCVFYGGRLLAHLTAKDPLISIDDLVNIFRVNRNSIIVIDSDRRKKGAKINPTKRRIVSEIEAMGGYSWVTFGREIENYIPKSAVSDLYDLELREGVTQYQAFDEFLESNIEGEGKRFLRNKALFAERINPFLSKENIIDVLDLKEKLNSTVTQIKKWNNL